MNKNHLLPALLFVLAACGGTTSSSAPASSIALDTNEYRFIGGQANIGSWTPANAPVMTRATGTNSFSWTGDLYEDSTWKLVIGTDWANGEVGPLSAGLTIIDKGVTWTKDAEGALVIPEDSNSGFDPGLGGVGNFSTKVDGNYTVTFVSLPALTRTFTIVRNGDPEVLPPSITDWALVGTINGWNAADQSFKLANLNDENESYSLTVNLYANEEFKFVKNGAWGGDLGFSALVNPNPLDLLDQGGNIKVVRDGSYSIAFDGETATVERAGSLVRPEGGLHLVGTVTDPGWTPSDTTLALTDTAGDAKYYGVFDLAIDKEFKIKNGTAWDVGFDAGFDKVASFPVGAMVSAGGNIKVLVGHAFLIEARVVGNSVRIVISPAWKTYGFPSLVYTPGVGTTAGYLNTTEQFWNAHAQMRVYGMDGTKTKVNFEYTGVATHEYLFKIEGNGAAKEARSVATGERQTYTLDISDLSETQRAGLNLVVFFHTLPTNPVEGTITVHSVSFAA